ncbi:MAG: GNAT family N-acetyltransferase [Woeseia sp.]
MQGEWASLLERCADSSVFQTYQWHQSWWKAFGGTDKLLLILCYSGSHLVGIAPMMVTTAHCRVKPARKEIRFIGSANNASDYCDFLIDAEFPGALEVLLRELCDSPSHADCLHLTNMQEHSRNQSVMRRFFQKRQSRFIVEIDQPAPCRVLGDVQEDKKTANKSSLRRRCNYFTKAGNLRFHRCKSEAEIFLYLEKFFDQHRSRRELAGTASQFLDPAQCYFFSNLVVSLFPQGWLKFDVMLFDGEPLAFHFGFEYRKRFIWYKPTFNVEFADKSPGEVLIKYLLDDAIARGLEEFDFTVGCEAFKMRFSNETRYNNRLIVFRSRYMYWFYRVRRFVRAVRRQNAFGKFKHAAQGPLQPA